MTVEDMILIWNGRPRGCLSGVRREWVGWGWCASRRGRRTGRV